MPRPALGIIETVGLAAAIEAADTAVKSANVALIGYELSKGGGMVTIKLEGDVGAVKAAVEAACAAAEKVNKVWSKQIIPRPHEEIEKLIITKDTVGIDFSTPDPVTEEIISDEEEKDSSLEIEEESIENEEIEENEDKENNEEDNVEEVESEKEDDEVCNLCKDAKCPRRKGDLRTNCINYEELKEVL